MARPLRLIYPGDSITSPREIADRKRPKVRPGFEEIRASVLEASPEIEFLKTEPRSNPERAVLFYLGRERGMSLKALAERFVMDDSAVSQGAKRLKRLRSENPKLDRILRRIEEERISNS